MPQVPGQQPPGPRKRGRGSPQWVNRRALMLGVSLVVVGHVLWGLVGWWLWTRLG